MQKQGQLYLDLSNVFHLPQVHLINEYEDFVSSWRVWGKGHLWHYQWHHYLGQLRMHSEISRLLWKRSGCLIFSSSTFYDCLKTAMPIDRWHQVLICYVGSKYMQNIENKNYSCRCGTLLIMSLRCKPGILYKFKQCQWHFLTTTEKKKLLMGWFILFLNTEKYLDKNNGGDISEQLTNDYLACNFWFRSFAVQTVNTFSKQMACHVGWYVVL